MERMDYRIRRLPALLHNAHPFVVTPSTRPGRPVRGSVGGVLLGQILRALPRDARSVCRSAPHEAACDLDAVGPNDAYGVSGAEVPADAEDADR